jgi:O-antigen ligase
MNSEWLKILLCALLLFSGTFLSTEVLVDQTMLIRFAGALSVSVIALIAFRKTVVQFLSKNLRPLDLVLFAYCVWQVIGIAWAPNKAEGFNDGAKVIAFLLAYTFFRSLLVSNDSWKERLPLIFSLVAFVFLCLTYKELIETHQRFGLDADTIYSLRYPSAQKNLISIYLMLSATFHLFLITQKVHWQRLFGAANILLMLPPLFIIGTRSVSVSLVFVGLVLLSVVLIKKRYKKYGLIGALVLVVLGGTHWWYANQGKAQPTEKTRMIAQHKEARKELNNLDLNKGNSTIDVNGSINERYFLWSKTLKIISETPFFGVGQGNWKLEFPRNGLAGLDRAEFRNTVFLRPHNDFLWILAETGIVGLVLWLLVFIVLIRDFWSKEGQANIFVFGVAAYAMASFFDFPKERAEHNLVLASLLALSTSRVTIKTSPLKAKSIYISLLFLGMTALVVYGIRYSGARHYFDFLKLKSEKKYERAIRKAEKVENYFFTLDHFNVPISWHAGICANNASDIDKSEGLFRRAYQFNPNNFHVLNNLGFCLSSKQKYNEAIPLFEQSLLINPHFEDSRFNLSYSLVMNGEFDRGKKVLERNVTDTAKRAVFLNQIELLRNQ